MRFAIYGRKSVYTGKGESVENQIETCRRYIFSKFCDVADVDIEVFEDEGFSAKNTDRPRFQQMLRGVRQGRFDFVVCYRLDRISRSVSDFSSLIEELGRRSIAFICVKEEFDTSKPMGKAMMYIASVFAQLERETIAERVRDNMLMLARSGRWLGGTPPAGFVSEKIREVVIDSKVKYSCRLRAEPCEIAAVSMIFDKFLQSRSVSAVGRYLTGQGVTARSGRPFSLPGIKEILQNPVYCAADAAALEYFKAKNADICFEQKDCNAALGLLSYNKRDYKQRNSPRQPVEKWVIAIGRHRGIVPGQKWVEAQRALEGIGRSGIARPRGECSLLSGLITCKKCGGRMYAKARSGGLFDYICGGKMRGGAAKCSCQNLAGRQTDDAVFVRLEPLFREIAAHPKAREATKNALRQGRVPGCGADGSAAREVLDSSLSPARLTMEEKRELIGILTAKIIWDGTDIHIFTGGTAHGPEE